MCNLWIPRQLCLHYLLRYCRADADYYLAGCWICVIFGNWDAVRENPGKATCVEYLYYFSATVAILTWISVAFAVVCGFFTKACSCLWGILCCKPCRNADAQ